MPSVGEVVRDPEFLALSREDQQQILADIDPDFAALPGADQQQLLGEFSGQPRDRSIAENVWEGVRGGLASSANTAANVTGLKSIGLEDTLRGWSRAAAPQESPEAGIGSAVERGIGASAIALPEWMASAWAGSKLGGMAGGAMGGPPGAIAGAIAGGIIGPALLGAAQRGDQGAWEMLKGFGTNALFAAFLPALARTPLPVRVPAGAALNTGIAAAEGAPTDEIVAQGIIGGATSINPSDFRALRARPPAAAPAEALRPASRPVASAESPTPVPATAAVGDSPLISDAPEPHTTTVIDPRVVRTHEVPLSRLGLSRDVPNFKADADPVTGVVAGNELGGKYERTGTAPIVAWERLDGTLEVITGRHRLDLARRTGERTIPTQILREADGFTQAKALAFDAHSNIRDGQGSIKDYAHYFRTGGEGGGRVQAGAIEGTGLLSRASGRAGWDIGRHASDGLYSLFAAGKINDAQAAAIARTAPDDAALQQVGAKYALDGKSADFATSVMRAAASVTNGDSGNLDLFGGNDAAILAAEKQAHFAIGKQKEIRDQISAVRGAAKNPDAAAKLGVDVRDPVALRAKIEELEAERGRWQQWNLHSDLVAQTRGESGSSIATTVPTPRAARLSPQPPRESANAPAEVPRDVALAAVAAADDARTDLPSAPAPEAIVPPAGDGSAGNGGRVPPEAPDQMAPPGRVPPGTPGRGFGVRVTDTTPKWEHSSKILGKASEAFVSRFLDDPAFARELESKRRGVLTTPQLQRLAERVGLSVDDYAKLSQGSILPADVQAHLANLIHGHLRILRDMDGALSDATRAGNDVEVARLAAGRDQVTAQAGKLFMTLEASRSEAGRTLGASRLLGTTSSRLVKQGLRLIMESDGIPDEVRARLATKLKTAQTDAERVAAIREAYLPGWWQKGQEWRVNALLSSPLTIMRNTTGNMLGTATRLAENVTGLAIDRAIPYPEGSPGAANRRRAIEIRNDLFGTFRGAAEGAKLALRMLKDENLALSQGRYGAEVQRLPAIEGFKGKVIRSPTRASAMMDALFYTMNAEGRRSQLAARQATNEGLRGEARANRIEQLVTDSKGVDRVLAERVMRGQVKAQSYAETLAAEAHRVGLEFTYQSDLGPTGQAAQRLLNADTPASKFAKTLVPFFRTPVNLAKFVAQRSFMGLLSPRNLTDFRSGNPELVTQAMARVALGSAVQVGLTAWAMQGRISGDPPDDPAARAALEATGWQPWSLRFGDTWISYRGISPASEHLAMAAEIAKAVTKDPNGYDVAAALVRSGAAMARTMVDQPHLTSVSDVLDALESSDTASGESTALRALGRFATGMVIPRGVAYVARTSDPLKRARPEGVLGAIQADIPGARETMPPLRDYLGRAQENPFSLLAALAPTVSDMPRTPLDAWMFAMQEAPDRAIVSYPSRTPLGRTLSAEDYDTIQRERGLILLPILEQIRTSTQRAGAPALGARQAVSKAASEVNERIRMEHVPGMEARALGIPEDESTLNAVRAVMTDGTLREVYSRPERSDDEKRQILGMILAAPKDPRARDGLRQLITAGNQAAKAP